MEPFIFLPGTVGAIRFTSPLWSNAAQPGYFNIA